MKQGYKLPVPIPTPIYHITHIDNLASIIQSGGCLSYIEKQQRGISHLNIAYDHIQDRRARTIVPCGPGGVLHDYVPFFFAPRPPMLYAIAKGYVEGYQGSQGLLIYLVTSAQSVDTSGSEWVFTDGHATVAISDFYDNLDMLEEIDWDVMRSRYWKDTTENPDRKRRRQAEFLIHNSCPWTLINEIGVIGPRLVSRVQDILSNTRHQPAINIHTDWYY